MTEEAKPSTSLFIKGIPATTTQDDLTNYFSQYGPIKNCFIVRKEGAQKVYGFVKYALLDDAKTAIAKAKNYKVDYAKPRNRTNGVPGDDDVPFYAQKDEVAKEEKPRMKDLNKKKRLHRLATKSVIFNNVTKSSLKKLQKYGQIVKIIHPLSVGPSSCLSDLLLNGKVECAESDVVSDDKVALVVFAQEDSAKKALEKEGSFKVSTEARKESRVVIRNIPFAVTLKELYDFIVSNGGVSDKEGTESCEKSLVLTELILKKGFAFVTFIQKDMAQYCVDKLTGKKLQNRELVFDFAVNKDEYLTQVENADARKVDEDEIVKNDVEDQIESIKSDVEDAEQDEDVEQEDIAEDEDVGCEIVFDSEDETEEKVVDEKPKRKEKTPEEEEFDRKCTIFVRNLHFDSTEDDIMELFSEYNPLYAKVCYKDGISKGTAFVRFRKPEMVTQVMDRYMPISSTTLTSEQKANSSFLVPDSGFSLNGRTLHILPVLKAAEIQKTEKNEKNDKRNLYLLREMLIPRTSPIYSTLSQKFLDNLQQLHKSRRKKLENPLFCVSRTRLSVRHLGKGIDVRKLKEICLDAVEAYRSQNEEELKKTVSIKQCKIVEKEGKSLGFGFIEFNDHEDALACLRGLRDSEAPTQKRIVVEFAVENTSILKRRAQKVQKVFNKTEKSDEKPVEKKKGFQRKENNTKAKPVEKPKKSEGFVKAKQAQNKPQLPKDSKQKPEKATKKRKTRDEIEEDSFANLVKKYKSKLLASS